MTNAQRHVDARPTWRCVRLTNVTTRLLAWNNRIEIRLATFAERFNVCPCSIRVDSHEVHKAGEVASVPGVLFLGSTGSQQVRHADHADGIPVAFVVDESGRIVFGKRSDDVLPLREPAVAFGVGYRCGTLVFLFNLEDWLTVGVEEDDSAGRKTLAPGPFQKRVTRDAAVVKVGVVFDLRDSVFVEP